jgi:DNA helicase HerA-like ATPase
MALPTTGNTPTLPPDFDRFPKDVKDWFRDTRQKVHTATSGGIEQRLADFLRDHKETLVPMFNADSWGLDFDELDKGGKVLLVDTNRSRFGKDGANLLGRLIIALIDDLSSRRTERDERSLKPVFVVIDEAHDYIEKDEVFADILEKARAQKIGITVAHHHEGQIDRRIEQSLTQGGLKTVCEDIGSVHIKTRRTEFDLRISPLEFSEEPLMEEYEYEQLRERLASEHPYKQSSRVVDIVEPTKYK